jgi:hypothetical protein
MLGLPQGKPDAVDFLKRLEEFGFREGPRWSMWGADATTGARCAAIPRAGVPAPPTTRAIAHRCKIELRPTAEQTCVAVPRRHQPRVTPRPAHRPIAAPAGAGRDAAEEEGRAAHCAE